MRTAKLALFMAVALLTSTQALAANIFGVEVVNYGMYKTVGNATDMDQDQEAASRVVSMAKHVMRSNRIPAKVGVEFGVEFVVRGVPSGSTVPLEAKLVHPTLVDPATGKESWSSSWSMRPIIGKTSYAGWEFAEDWEVALGEWSLQIFYDGKLMAEKTFELVQDQAAPTQGDLHISLDVPKEKSDSDLEPGENRPQESADEKPADSTGVIQDETIPEAAAPVVAEKQVPTTSEKSGINQDKDKTATETIENSQEPDPDDTPKPPVAQAPDSKKRYVQVGVFGRMANAAEMGKEVAGLGFTPMYVDFENKKGRALRAVVIGEFEERTKARTLASEYKEKSGKRAYIVTFPDNHELKAEAAPPPTPEKAAPADSEPEQVADAGNQAAPANPVPETADQQEPEEQTRTEAVAAKEVERAATRQPEAKTSDPASKVYAVQLGAFSKKNHADEMKKRFTALGLAPEVIEFTTSKGKKLLAVIAGWYENKSDAMALVRHIKANWKRDACLLPVSRDAAVHPIP